MQLPRLNHVKLPRLKLRLFWFSFSSLLPVPPSVPLRRQSYSAPALLLTEVYFLFSPLKLLLILAFLSFPSLLSLSKFATNYAMLSPSFNCFRFLLFLQFYILGFIILSAAPCVLSVIIPRVKFSSFLSESSNAGGFWLHSNLQNRFCPVSVFVFL